MSGDWGCVLLRWRGSDNPPIAGDSLFEQSPGVNVIYIRDPQTCCWCETIHAAVLAVAENPLKLRRLLLAPSGLCATGSEVLILATKPLNTAPRTHVDASVLTTTRDVSLCHGLRASMLPWETAMRNQPKVHTVQVSRSSAKSSAGACVVNCSV